MKCRTCGKEIPETSQVCPFCYTTVVREEVQNTNLNNTSNLTTINTDALGVSPSSNGELNFGDLTNTSYDNNNIKIAEKKKKKSPVGVIIVLGVLLLGAIITVILFILSRPKVYEYQYYQGIVDKAYDYLYDNILDPDTSNNGKYKIYYTYENVTKEFKGDYKFDISKKSLSITGREKNPEEEKSGVVVGELPTTEFEFVLKNNNAYFYSKDIYNQVILLPYEDEYGFLATKQYELEPLIEGYKDATKAALKELTYETTKKVKIDGYGDEEFTKTSLKIDYKNKCKYLITFYDTLLNDSNFVSEYAKIKNRKDEDIEKTFKNYKLTYEHKYSTDDGELSYLDIYYKNKDIVRIEYIDVRKNTKTQFNLKKNELNIDSYVEDNKISSINITKFEQTMNDKLTRTYNITYEKDEKSSTFNIELTKGENTSVKINELENTRNIRELTEEEFNNIKANIKQYINNDELINMIPKIFATKCTQDLKCVCNNTSCSCEVNDRIIECPLGTVSSSNAE